MKGCAVNVVQKVAEARRADIDRQAAAIDRAVAAAWKTYASAVTGERVTEKDLAGAVALLNIPPDQIATDVDLVRRAVETQHRIDQAPHYLNHQKAARAAFKQAEEAFETARRKLSACRCRVGSYPHNVQKVAELIRINPRLFQEIDLAGLAAKLPPDGPPIVQPMPRTLLDRGHPPERAADTAALSPAATGEDVGVA